MLIAESRVKRKYHLFISILSIYFFTEPLKLRNGNGTKLFSLKGVETEIEKGRGGIQRQGEERDTE
jgi:hypothetical protein